MIRALPLLLIALPAQADVLICGFAPDAPLFDFGGHSIPIRVVPEEGVEAPSYVTLGHGDREIITLFNGFDAIHTRHFTYAGAPASQTTIGRCTSFY